MSFFPTLPLQFFIPFLLIHCVPRLAAEMTTSCWLPDGFSCYHSCIVRAKGWVSMCTWNKIKKKTVFDFNITAPVVCSSVPHKCMIILLFGLQLTMGTLTVYDFFCNIVKLTVLWIAWMQKRGSFFVC